MGYINFLQELLRSRATKLLLAAYGLWAFTTTVVDQFFPHSSDKLKTIYLLPRWHWYTWAMVGLGLVALVLLDGAYKIWKEKEILGAETKKKSPQVILDFVPLFGDEPMKRHRALIVRNVGSETAVNVRLQPFLVGKATVVCDLVGRLLPNTDTARLTAELRRGSDIRKPCLVELESLFESELGKSTAEEATPTILTVTYEDLAGGRYRVEYSIKYRSGINECQTEFKTLLTS